MKIDGITQPFWSTPFDDAEMFELAPVALLLQDMSPMHALLQRWRADGVIDLRAFLDADPRRVLQCVDTLRIIKMNRQMLRLFDIADAAALKRSLIASFTPGVAPPLVEHLVQLWNGELNFYAKSGRDTLGGKRLDLIIRAMVLPGHESNWARVLMTYQDISREEQALRQLTDSERYARSLFEQSPVALMAEDFSGLKAKLDALRASGVTDLRDYAARHPEFILQCIRLIRVIDINQQTLALFEAKDKPQLLSALDNVLTEDVLPDFVAELTSLWDGKLSHQAEVVNYTLSGKPLNLVLQASIIPGHEHDWGVMLVALVDITARKRAESHLEFISCHDVLTGLYNRSYFLREISRLEQDGCYPVTIFMIDLDGLKQANDALGHAAGDALLLRAGQVLSKATDKPCCAARVGGDEFALIVPLVGEVEATRIGAQIETLVALDNRVRDSFLLSLSIGASTCHGPGRMEATIRQADLRMYEAKRRFYATKPGPARGAD